MPVLVTISRPVAIRKKICRSLPSSVVAPRSPRGREKIRREVVVVVLNKRQFGKHNFSRLVMVIIRILQPFLCFFLSLGFKNLFF